MKFKIEEDVEVSMEVNPAAVTEDKLLAFRKAGLNRIGMGAQSFDDASIENPGENRQGRADYRDRNRCKKCGNRQFEPRFRCSAFPGRRSKAGRKAWRRQSHSAPEHISLYSLEIMDNTRFARDCDKGKIHPSDHGRG